MSVNEEIHIPVNRIDTLQCEEHHEKEQEIQTCFNFDPKYLCATFTTDRGKRNQQQNKKDNSDGWGIKNASCLSFKLR